MSYYSSNKFASKRNASCLSGFLDQQITVLMPRLNGQDTITVILGSQMIFLYIYLLLFYPSFRMRGLRPITLCKLISFNSFVLLWSNFYLKKKKNSYLMSFNCHHLKLISITAFKILFKSNFIFEFSNNTFVILLVNFIIFFI